MSKVSCIVSAYYAEQYLEGRIQNLLAQKPQPEIVIVCQRDSAEHRIATEAGKTTDAITLVLTADIPTIYAAWNMGIRAAAGDYVTNSNSDDRLYPSALRKLADALDRNRKYNVA